jgi:hypothetical protein
VYVQTFAVPKVGDKVQIAFRVPFEDEFGELDSEVAWARGEDQAQSIADVGFGARFNEVPSEVEERILKKIQIAESEFFA